MILIHIFLGIAKPDENLNSSQKAVNHLATVAIENHTCIASLHWRYGFNMPEFYDKLLEPYFMKVWSLQVFRYLVPKGMLLRTKLHGLGRLVIIYNTEVLGAQAKVGRLQFFDSSEEGGGLGSAGG